MNIKKIIAAVLLAFAPTLALAYPACPSDITGAEGPCGVDGTLTINSGGSVTGNTLGSDGTTSRYFALSNPTPSTITINGSVTNDSTGSNGIGLWNYPSTTLSSLEIGLSGSITGGAGTGGTAGYGVYNDTGSTITNLLNGGVIKIGTAVTSSVGTALFNATGGTITTLTNNRYIGTPDGSNAAGLTGISNNGTITTLTNNATILGDHVAVVNNGSIETLTNNSGAFIGGGSALYGIGNSDNASTIGTINNFGTITGLSAAIESFGSIGLINNSSTGIISASVYNGFGTITAITNSGTISSSSFVNRAIHNLGTIGSITNNSTGTISGRDQAIVNYSNIGTLDNAGIIRVTTPGNAIENDSGATITTLTNSRYIGTSDGTSYDGGDRGISNSGTISTLTNTSYGVIMGTNYGLSNSGTVTTLSNSGTIRGNNTSGIFNSGNIVAINNSGTISGGANGISQAGTIGTLTNTGTISGGTLAGINISGSNIETLTNFGTIAGGIAGIYMNSYQIGTLNNAQSGLTILGALPANYNVIVNSNTNYGRLTSLGIYGDITNFGIYNGSTLTKGTYAAVLSGLTSTNVSSATRSGMYNGTAWTLALESDSTTIWDLIVQSSATNTLASVQQNSNGLATVYNQQSAAYQAALSYDCQVYDENNLCVSVGGRYTYAGPSPSSNQQAGLVILGYKPVQTFRVGAFADQSVNISTPTGFSQSKTSPMWGFFAKWHKNKDETGLGVQASAVTSASSLTATRPQLFNTETGSGSTQFNGQGYQLTTNYHQPVTNNTSVVPYLGLRYTRINAGAYTENTTATVTSPLSYNAMAQNTFSAIAGLGVRSHLAEKLTGTASVGIQQNLNYSMGNYAGTSNITGLESFSVQMPGNVNSMATATAGMFYDINKRERVGFNVLWQQQPFIATNTTTALATYTIGF